LFITFYSKKNYLDEQYIAIETPVESIAPFCDLPVCLTLAKASPPLENAYLLLPLTECLNNSLLIREAKAKHKQTVERGGV